MSEAGATMAERGTQQTAPAGPDARAEGAKPSAGLAQGEKRARQVPLALQVPHEVGRVVEWLPGIHDDAREALWNWCEAGGLTPRVQESAPAGPPHAVQVHGVHALYLWGESGSGKSHALDWLAAQVTAANEPDALRLGATTPASDWQLPEGCRWVLIDDVDRLDSAQQHAAFTLLVSAQQARAAWVCSGRTPPAQLAEAGLRADLRSRVLWGPTLALSALDDAQLRTVLEREARRRGIVLGTEVLEYLMRRAERDFAFLHGVLDHLDRYALAEQRAVTVPLVRRMLAEEGWRDPAVCGRPPGA